MQAGIQQVLSNRMSELARIELSAALDLLCDPALIPVPLSTRDSGSENTDSVPPTPR